MTIERSQEMEPSRLNKETPKLYEVDRRLIIYFGGNKDFKVRNPQVLLLACLHYIIGLAKSPAGILVFSVRREL